MDKSLRNPYSNLALTLGEAERLVSVAVMYCRLTIDSRQRLIVKSMAQVSLWNVHIKGSYVGVQFEDELPGEQYSSSRPGFKPKQRIQTYSPHQAGLVPSGWPNVRDAAWMLCCLILAKDAKKFKREFPKAFPS